MSDEFDEQMVDTYRINEVETMARDELQSVFLQALGDLRNLRLEYDDFQRK